MKLRPLCRYTSYLAPISSSKLWNEARRQGLCGFGGGTGTGGGAGETGAPGGGVRAFETAYAPRSPRSRILENPRI